MQIDQQNNDFSNAEFHNSTGIQNTGSEIKNQKNIFIFKNKEIDKIKTDIFQLRSKMVFFITKLLIALFFVILIISVLGMKFYNFDNFFSLFVISIEALPILVIYFIFNKFYYKEYKAEQKDTNITDSEKFTILAIADIILFALLFKLLS